MSIGLFGGTFDPPHRGHLLLAKSARLCFSLESVCFLPANASHEKTSRTAGSHRLAMVQRAVADTEGFFVDDVEFRRGGISYTIDTVRWARSRWGGEVPLVLLMGSDQFYKLPTWESYLELLNYVHIAVASRHRELLSGLADIQKDAQLPLEMTALCKERGRLTLPTSPAGAIVFFPMPMTAVSSTEIRDAFSLGRIPTDSVPSSVLSYIGENRLYLGTDAAAVGGSAER